MHTVVVVNGELPANPDPSLTELLVQADQLVAVDGGLVHCVQLGVWPTVLIGDLDSAPPELVAQATERQVHLVKFPSNKDATDLALALAFAVDAGATAFTIVAAFGGRLDHELANIALLASDEWRDVVVEATDGVRSLRVVRDRCDLALTPGDSVSLVPWNGDVVGVTTSGLRWPLRAATLALGTTWGVSNVAEAPQQSVTIGAGVLLVISDRTKNH